MNKIIRALWFFILVPTYVHGALGSETFADSLYEDADAVISLYTITYDRSSISKYSKKTKMVITLLNDRARHLAYVNIPYDRNTKVKYVIGSLVDQNNKVLFRMAKSTMRDEVNNATYIMSSDQRHLFFHPVIPAYPCTLEYEYVTEHKSLIGFGPWLPHFDFNVSVKEASLVFKTKAAFELKSKTVNHAFQFSLDTSNRSKLTYTWTAKQLKAIPRVKNLPNYLHVFPAVILGPNRFSYENNKGRFESWNTYGKWVYQLCENQNKLSSKTVQQIHAMCDTFGTEKEKISAIYNYVQRNTRYVNISLGIGGFQPLNSNVVEQRGYGDCKALTNYMKVLLSTVGIQSYYAEVGVGSFQKIVYPDFATVTQTNHVILCVPLQKDTIWLDCTNQNLPFGHVGSDNYGRYALLIKESGGELVKISKDKSSFNYTRSKTVVNLSSSNPTFVHRSKHILSQYDLLFPVMYGSINQMDKKDIIADLFAQETVIKHFECRDITKRIPLAELTVKGEVPRITKKVGNQLLVTSQGLFKHPLSSVQIVDRDLPFHISTSVIYSDTIEFVLPNNKGVTLPEGDSLSCEFGWYQVHYTYMDSVLKRYTKLAVLKGTYPKNQFNSINHFLGNIRQLEAEYMIIQL